MAFILPVFEKFQAEGESIGRLIIGYDELEIALCRCVAEAVNDLDMVVKKLFGKRLGEKQRIKKAVSIGQCSYQALGLQELFNEIICEMHHCRLIRNQFSHCAFYEDPDNMGHLLFTNIEDRAKCSQTIVELTPSTVPAKRVTQALLEEHETYFTYVWGRLNFIECEARVRAGKSSANAYTIKKVRKPETHLTR